MSLVLPPADEMLLSDYLTAAERALAVRSDAEMARCLGVRPHLIANWRRRRKIPEEYEGWFRSSFVEKIGTYNLEMPKVSYEARAAVVNLLGRAGGNPMAIAADAEFATAMAMGGFLALAQFLIDVAADHLGDGRNPDLIARAMLPLMTDLRNADHLRQFGRAPASAVPQ